MGSVLERSDHLRNRVYPYESDWDWRKSHPRGTYINVNIWVTIPGTNVGYWEVRRIRLA